MRTYPANRTKDRMMSNSRTRFSRTALLPYLLLVMAMIVGCSGRPLENHEQYADLVAGMGGEIHAHLEFKGSTLSDEDLQNLKFADTVRSVSLSHTPITDAGVAELSRAANLEHVDLTSTKITNETIALLKELPKLRGAEVIALNVSREGAEELSDYLNQRHAEAGLRSSRRAFPRVPGAEQETPEYPGPPGEEARKPEVRLSRYAEDVQWLDGELQLHLDFSHSAITDEDLIALPFPDSVRSISLRGTAISDRGVGELRRAKNLESLDLRSTQVTDEASDTLKQLPRLSNLDVGATQMSQEKQQALRRYLIRHSAVIRYDTSRVLGPAAGNPASRPPSP